jgi:hypothetical protein
MDGDVVKNELAAPKPDSYERKPAWWSLLLLYFFPIVWLYGTVLLLILITEICFFFNFNLASAGGTNVLLAPFFIVPLFAGLFLLVWRRWFGFHMMFFPVAWFLILCFSGFTQGSVNSALNRAMAVPGHGELHHYTERVPYNQR